MKELSRMMSVFCILGGGGGCNFVGYLFNKAYKTERFLSVPVIKLRKCLTYLWAYREC